MSPRGEETENRTPVSPSSVSSNNNSSTDLNPIISSSSPPSRVTVIIPSVLSTSHHVQEENNSLQEQQDNSTTTRVNLEVPSSFPLLEMEGHDENMCIPSLTSMSLSSCCSSSSSLSTISHTSSTNKPTNLKSCMASSTDSTHLRKKVQFQSLHVRTFIQILGDHPCCTSGLPLTFDWDPIQEDKYTLEEYESNGLPRRRRQEMRLDDAQRRNILSGASFMGKTVGMAGDNNKEQQQQQQQQQNNNDSGGEDLNLFRGSYLSELDLKRAERRMYRNRERMRKKAITSRFFRCPIAGTE